MNNLIVLPVGIFSYLLGSIPTAYIISKRFKGVDIRTLGDGNMGARNAFHVLGARFGYLVALADICKGALPVLIARLTGLTPGFQFIVGVLVILGHDFPVFAGFKGGQGLATSTGTMLVLFPLATCAGLAVYGIMYLIIRSSQISAGVGGGITALILAITQQWPQLIYAVAVFLFVPLKQFIDTPRRRAITAAKNKEVK